MIAAAERPVLFIGHGVTLSQASVELTEFARKLRIPVISSPNGMGCLDMDDPLALGFIGRNGAYPANEAGRRSDLVIAIGARFDDRSSSSWMPGYRWNFPTTKLIHVDIDPGEVGRNYPPDLAILADARTFLRQVLGEISAKGGRRQGLQELARRDRRLAEAMGGVHRAELRGARQRRCGPSASSRTAARCCPTTPSSPAMSASITTGTCSSGRPGDRGRCSTRGASRPWASARPACSAQSSRRRTSRASL